MKYPSVPLCLALAVFGIAPGSTFGQGITLEDQINVDNGAEIIAYSADGDTVATNVTGTAPTIGVQLLTLNTDASLTAGDFVSVSTQFGGAIASVSSVALDPLGRDFGVMTVIPTANGTVNGVAIFFDYVNGTVLSTVEVGFHPDSVIFSRDGSKVFVANEGEFTSGGDTDAPGSISVIDLAGITSAVQAGNLDNTDVTTVDFSAANLASGVVLTALRFNDTTFTPGNAHRHVEPEYITEGEGKIYVTLQENNAIAEFTLTGANANKITAIYPLGLIEQTIDASDRDNGSNGPSALIDDVVKGMPMPDTVTSFLSGGTRFLVTANEGDFRPDDGDRIRVADAAFTGTELGVTIDRGNAAFGRLRVLRDQSDPDGNNLIDEMIMPGTRSFTVWNASTGARVADTGSFEPLLLSLYPTIHNINGETGTGAATLDARSPDKGPEPEAIASGVINGHRYIFVGMERQGAILMYNLDNPANPTFVTSINNVLDGLLAPESITFIGADESPIGEPTLLIGYEVGGKIGVYTVEGEPADPLTLSIKSKKITVGPGTQTVPIKGTASANTVSVTVNGKPAQGTTSWKAKVKFPKNKKTAKVTIVATSNTGVTKTETLTLVRRG